MLENGELSMSLALPTAGKEGSTEIPEEDPDETTEVDDGEEDESMVEQASSDQWNKERETVLWFIYLCIFFNIYNYI